MKHQILKTSIITLLCIIFSLLTSIHVFAATQNSSTSRFKTLSTVSMIIVRKNGGQTEILLQKRKDTGWMDGFWELGACGHVEKGETLKQAAIRETKEELGLDLKEQDLDFVGLNHNNIEKKGTYYCMYFKVNNFSGTPTIGEPEKCAEIKWFPITNLPQNIIPIRKIAIENYLNNKIYDEIGW